MANESSSIIYEEKCELIGSIKNKSSSFSPRTARFLYPLAKTVNQTSPFSKLTENPNPHFKGWNNHLPNRWPDWVNQMMGKYSSVWIKAGIFDSILNSMYEITCNPNVVSSLVKFWSPKTTTFVFPWGEATISLEDVMILGGFSVLGECVDRCVLREDWKKKVEEINQVRAGLVSSKAKKASYSQWISNYMGSENENEHVAFLSMWLSMLVFPQTRDSIGKHVIEIAVVLSQGKKLDLASAVLASIYSNLTSLKEQHVDSSNCCINLLGVFQLVQVWMYERFPIIGPETPNELSPGETRLARWHALNTDVTLPLLCSYLINVDNFIWRPYAVDLKNWRHPLYYKDNEEVVSNSWFLDDDLLSFIRFIQPYDLNGLSCKAMYSPHRVAMQFGFDQDIPQDICSYNLVKSVKVLVPSRLFQPGVSKRYLDWWNKVDQEDCKSNQETRNCEQENHKRKKLGELGIDLNQIP